MYDPTIFQRGQMFRRDVIQHLANQRIDYFRLPDNFATGEIVRKAFYTNLAADRCAEAILAHVRALAPPQPQHDHHARDWVTERAIWAIEEVLGLHQPQPADGWAEWYEYAAAGEW